MASALAHCHSKAALGGPALLHRDVKPANVVLEALPAIPLPSTKQRSRLLVRRRAAVAIPGDARGLWAVRGARRPPRAHGAHGQPALHGARERPLLSLWYAVGRLLRGARRLGRVFTKTAVPRPQHEGARGKGHRRAPAPAALADAPPELDDLLSRAWAPHPSSRPDAADLSTASPARSSRVRFAAAGAGAALLRAPIFPNSARASRAARRGRGRGRRVPNLSRGRALGRPSARARPIHGAYAVFCDALGFDVAGRGRKRARLARGAGHSGATPLALLAARSQRSGTP